jgi:hypothetical protein
MSKTQDDDEKLALDFLAGTVEPNKQGLPTLKYLPAESKQETEARAALVRLLVRRKLSGELCHALALLFDAQALDQIGKTSISAGDHWRARYRKIVFKQIRGAPSKRYSRSAIAVYVWRNVVVAGMRPEQAKKQAAETYGLSIDAIKSIWKEWGPHARRFFPAG